MKNTILCILLWFAGVSCLAQQQSNLNPGYLVKPVFSAGDVNKFIRTHCNYPESAKEKGIAGKVLVKVTIDKQGNAVNPLVVQSVNTALDHEALRVVTGFPRFKPATYKGMPIEYTYIVPVTFRLE